LTFLEDLSHAFLTTSDL
jgi:protein tyrosine phosphatase